MTRADEREREELNRLCRTPHATYADHRRLAELNRRATLERIRGDMASREDALESIRRDMRRAGSQP